MWGNEPSHSQGNSHSGSWSPGGLPNLQRAIAGVKTHWIEALFISLEVSWNINVWNGLAWPVWTSENKCYGQKKGWESNCQFDSRPLKIKNWPNFLVCRWRATYRWKDLNKGYNFALDFISIKGLQRKLWAPKVVGVPSLGILGLPFGSPETKCHLDVGLVERRRVYYKGEGGGFPQVWAMVSLVSSNLPVARPNTKSAPTKH
jgi:hypothetical protein